MTTKRDSLEPFSCQVLPSFFPAEREKDRHELPILKTENEQKFSPSTPLPLLGLRKKSFWRRKEVERRHLSSFISPMDLAPVLLFSFKVRTSRRRLSPIDKDLPCFLTSFIFTLGIFFAFTAGDICGLLLADMVSRELFVLFASRFFRQVLSRNGRRKKGFSLFPDENCHFWWSLYVSERLPFISMSLYYFREKGEATWRKKLKEETQNHFASPLFYSSRNCHFSFPSYAGWLSRSENGGGKMTPWTFFLPTSLTGTKLSFFGSKRWPSFSLSLFLIVGKRRLSRSTIGRTPKTQFLEICDNVPNGSHLVTILRCQFELS